MENCFQTDENFNQLYPEKIRLLARKHWTPILVTEKISNFLAVKDAKVLDIGSGVGKFCLYAAKLHPQTTFYGIEQRPALVKEANSLKNKLALNNVHFIAGNFIDLDFSEFDHFYFYNSFYENLRGTEKIDDTVSFHENLYSSYRQSLLKKLDQAPSGTRLATFHYIEDEVPRFFLEVGADINNQLKFWIKE